LSCLASFTITQPQHSLSCARCRKISEADFRTTRHLNKRKTGSIFVHPSSPNITTSLRTSCRERAMHSPTLASKPKWSLSLSTDGDDEVVAVVLDDSTGKIFVCGHTSGALYGSNSDQRDKDVFVVQRDASIGSEIWSRQMGSDEATDFATAAALDSKTGDLFLAGNTGGQMFGAPAGGQDFFLCKLDGRTGRNVWSVQAGTEREDSAFAVAADGNGNAFVCGTTGGQLFDDGGDGISSPGGTTAFCAKYRGADGALLWGVQLAGAGYDSVLGAAVDAAGEALVVSGYTGGANGMPDFFICNLAG
ncbi:unnamed protein product, partial [Phaeothamnion confervicola]